MFEDELTSILHKGFEKLEKGGKLPNSFYEATVTLIPQLERHHKKTNRQL